MLPRSGPLEPDFENPKATSASRVVHADPGKTARRWERTSERRAAAGGVGGAMALQKPLTEEELQAQLGASQADEAEGCCVVFCTCSRGI